MSREFASLLSLISLSKYDKSCALVDVSGSQMRDGICSPGLYYIVSHVLSISTFYTERDYTISLSLEDSIFYNKIFC